MMLVQIFIQFYKIDKNSILCAADMSKAHVMVLSPEPFPNVGNPLPATFSAPVACPKHHQPLPRSVDSSKACPTAGEL